MIYQITGNTAPEAFREMLITMPGVAKKGDSRNGPVFAVPYPTLLTIRNPTERVVFDPIRDANPFFHMFEAIWMFAGSDDGNFPAKFVPRYIDYAEDDGYVHGAYGMRWRFNFRDDQLKEAIELLVDNPSDRQVVIQMWDPDRDLGTNVRDRPCNTNIYLRADNGVLDMTVCSRSNDAIWGMLGANVVHMTMLHEFLSVATKIPLGTYYVFANNLHVYPELVKNFSQMWTSHNRHDPYQPDGPNEPYVTSGTLLQEHEDPAEFLEACEGFICYPKKEHGFYFLDHVATPMYMLWENRDLKYAQQIQAPDWRMAGCNWVERHVGG